MIHEERVILMTQLQAYEDCGGKKDIAIASYFRGDYLGSQMLKSVISVTIAAAIGYAGYVFYNLESFMKDLYQTDWIEYVSILLTRYLVLVIGYALITYLIYAYRYAKAKKNLKKYYGGLRKLSAMYHEES
ncbi:MAG: hypothetical protein HFI07_14255 [Lachnospiraceae bacterium]|jgi:hypothetical protein|nr:hypothetical protein [Lachnospiraceae bacterium]